MVRILFFIAALMGLHVPALAAIVQVSEARLWDGPDRLRLVFDLDRPPRFKHFTLDDPQRLVVDLQRARLRADLPTPPARGILRRLRSAHHGNGTLRIVLDLEHKVSYRVYTVAPHGNKGHRLVVELHKPARRNAPPPAKAIGDGGPRPVVVAIDAGHGGEDPGARGRHGTHEKDVVLAIARRLAKLVDREPGMRAVLIRDGDYYIGLKDRIRKARQARADLFVSIHADAFRNPKVRGSSVYVLSQRGASSEMARWLAERENSADLIGGVRLSDKDDMLASVLLDLSLTGTIEASTRAAEKVLRALGRVNAVHRDEVQYAGFVVLKSPDIPSMLVETAFISNPAEERRLRSPRHQQRLARAILQGIRDYFLESPPPGTLMAERKRSHVVRPGETLSELARQYRTTVRALRESNGLSDDLVRVGQVLAIP